jgi:hypothetical protein
LWAVFRNAEAYPSTHLIAQKVGFVDIQIIQDGDNITYHQSHCVGFGIVGLAAVAMPSSINQNEPIFFL